jgi:hypothetical protein
MDLLACSDCGHRFYLPGNGAMKSRWCPQCGGDLGLALHGMTSIPLDARWLDPRVSAAGPPPVTVVELRRKGERAGKTGKRILRQLGDYFAVKANGGRSVEVSVNRGRPVDATLRVAAVLDGVDAGWEQHFYLPTADAQGPHGDELSRPPLRSRSGLRLVASNGDRFQSEGPA